MGHRAKSPRLSSPCDRGTDHALRGATTLARAKTKFTSCQEVEVAKRLRAARDQAFWFSGYNPARVPAIWRPWVSSLGDAPDWLVSLDTTIRQRISSRKGGMPDVVAWNDLDPLGSAIFIECKGRGEPFLAAQEDWAWAALGAGVGLTQIAVAVLPL
jgi:VRR-NUC domain-containing protein